MTTYADSVMLSVFFPNLHRLLHSEPPHHVEETRAAAHEELESILRDRQAIRSLLSEGANIVRETLYPVAALGRFQTPAELRTHRQRLELWFQEAGRGHGADGHLVAPEMRNLLVRCLEALLWCSGSADFQDDGMARVGWEKECVPLIAELRSMLIAKRDGPIDPNTAVTDAIVKAEGVLDQAIAAWKQVLLAEERCTDDTTMDLERVIALRGAARAQIVIDVLGALR